jgi:predicted AlkP superfamily phosphohydrolase/phosphomutase
VKKEPHKFIIIGIDGGNFKVIDYLASRGRLPNLSKLMSGGVKAELVSTIPPLSHTAWVSLYTGKNPGKHGVCDAVRRRRDSYSLQPINANLVAQEPLWSVLSRHSKRVCIYNVPITYPPRPVNGIIISGMDTPGTNSPFAYPENTKEEILKNFPHYKIDLPLDTFVSAHHPQPIKYQVEKIYEGLETQLKMTDYLLSKEDWDFFFGVITATDRLQHLLWRYTEKKCEGQEMTEEEEGYAEKVFGAYTLIDEAIGQFLQRYGPRWIMVLSDHGFGLLTKDVHLNNFLAEHGLLSYYPQPFLRRGQAYVRRLARKNLPSTFKRQVKRFLPIGQPFFERLAQQIDWKKTKVYSLGYFGNLFVNLKGREPLGIVEHGEEYESVMEEVISRLHELRDPEDGKAVIERVYRKEELYHGEALDLLPDVLLVMRNYAYMALNQFGEIEPSKGIFGKPLKGMGELTHTGSHRSDGILILYGENVEKGRTGKASMLDIAPTVLYVSEVPIVKGYDGKILLDFFEPPLRKAKRIDYDLYEYSWKEGAYYSESEEKEVKNKLQGLGYL